MGSATGGQELTMEDDLDDLYGDSTTDKGPAVELQSEEPNPAKAQSSSDASTNVQLPGISDQDASEDTMVEEIARPSANVNQSTQSSDKHSNGLSAEHKATSTASVSLLETISKSKEELQGEPNTGLANQPTASKSRNTLAQDPVTSNQAEWEVDSSPYESSSDDSSDTTSSGSEDGYELLDPAEQARRLMEGDANSDGEGGSKEAKGTVIKSHNEQTDEPVIKPDITVTEDMPIEILGTVETIVDNIVLIKASISGEYEVLESGSLLCLSSRAVIGVVSETLGRVQQPLYCVRFKSGNEILENGLAMGSTIYYVPQHSTFVFTKALQGVKGSDASNIHDEEIAADEIEFSDDEAELAYKRSLKAQKREKRVHQSGQRANGYAQSRDGDGAETPAYINYDDEPQDDLYTPLTRPSNLHEMMNQTSRPARGSGGGYRGNRGRGDRRGDRGHHRGRGDRGRGQHQPERYSAASQSNNYTPTAGPQSPGAVPPFGYHPPGTGMQPMGHSYSTPTAYAGGSPSAFQPSFATGPPFNQGYQQHYPNAQYHPSQSSWPPHYVAQQHFGQQAQHPPPPPPPQYPYGPGSTGSSQFPQGAAVNPRFFQPPHNQYHGQ